MTGQIIINYEEVYSKLATLRNHIESEVRDMNNSYRQANFAINRMDGRTNALISETMLANQRKSQVTADTVTKLLMFINDSTRQVERGEQAISRIFDSSMMRTARPMRA